VRRIHGPTTAEYSGPRLEHASPLEDHGPSAAGHVRFAQAYGLSPCAHQWYDDSHIADGRAHAVRAERTEVQPAARPRGFVNQRQERSLNAYRGALTFVAERPLAFAPELSHLCERLSASVEAIDDAAGKQQLRGGKLLGEARRRLDQIRQKHMLPLGRLTRRLFSGEPRIRSALKVPHKRASTEELFAASASIVKTLGSQRKFLSESRVDPGRIDRLREETRQAKQLFVAANVRTPESAIATRRLSALFVEARADFAAIDGLVTLACKPEELIAWRTMTRVGKRMGRPRKQKWRRRKGKGTKTQAKAKKAKKARAPRNRPR